MPAQALGVAAVSALNWLEMSARLRCLLAELWLARALSGWLDPITETLETIVAGVLLTRTAYTVPVSVSWAFSSDSVGPS